MSITYGDALAAYPKRKTPAVIVSDGPYGLGMFDGDPYGVEGLADFYEPHVIEWSKRSTNQTTLWFWCTEIGRATVHPVLERHGWRYASCHVWNKGLAHVAGNVNTGTIRKFPVVTAVCVQYVMDRGGGRRPDQGLASRRVGAHGPSALPRKRGMRPQERRDAQVPYKGPHVVHSAPDGV